MTDIKKVYPTFTGLDSCAFKKKVYDTCVLYAMKNYDTLKGWYGTDMFPSEKYYTLADNIKLLKLDVMISEPPRKTFSSILKKTPNESDDNDYDSDTDKKEKRKTYPLVLNRNAKSMIDLLINRFYWEVYHIEPTGDEKVPETKLEVAEYILTNVADNFVKPYNISQLIINSVMLLKPSKTIDESYGLDKEMRTRFDVHLKNSNFAVICANYMTDFLKLLMIYLSNRFWLEKSQTANIKSFDTVLRYIEMTIPTECKTISHGYITDMYIYDSLTNPAKTESDKKETDKMPKIPKIPKIPKMPKTPKVPKVPKAPKTPKIPKIPKKPIKNKSSDDDAEISYDSDN
jgi:hypothetical protein